MSLPTTQHMAQTCRESRDPVKLAAAAYIEAAAKREAAIEAAIAKLRAAHMTSSPDGCRCCADDSWRGRFCPYHQGIADVCDDIEAAMREGK